jgi:hypothetical protein
MVAVHGLVRCRGEDINGERARVLVDRAAGKQGLENFWETSFRSLEYLGLLEIEIMDESWPKIRAVLCWNSGRQQSGVEGSQGCPKKRVAQHYAWWKMIVCFERKIVYEGDLMSCNP